MILAGDIGGTNARLAYFEPQNGHLQLISESVFPSREYGELGEIVSKFLSDTSGHPEIACFGIAGPVQNGRVETSNLPWIIGGYYVFTREALGEYPGFVVGWTDWLANCGSSSAVAIVIGEYTLLLFPALRLSPNLIACLVVIAIALLQWTGVKKSSLFQQFSRIVLMQV